MRPWPVLLLLVALPGPLQAPAWVVVAPRAVHRSGTLAPGMAEASGAAVSRRNPGIVWTINDSGNPAELIATDTLGRMRGRITLEGASNTDWEEVALGGCGERQCVYIADAGDNAETRPSVELYRLEEPVVGTASGVPFARRTGEFERLRFRYPDGPHDVEAMAVLANGDVVLVTKGRSHGVLEFRLPAVAWTAGGVAVAERIDSLPIAASSATGSLVTGMAISPDRRHAVVRSYRELFLFTIDPAGRMRPEGRPTACDILGLEPQGEGVDFLDDRRLVLTSERGLFASGSVYVVECPAR